jgi:hypothetical protein
MTPTKRRNLSDYRLFLDWAHYLYTLVFRLLPTVIIRCLDLPTDSWSTSVAVARVG